MTARVSQKHGTHSLAMCSMFPEALRALEKLFNLFNDKII